MICLELIVLLTSTFRGFTTSLFIPLSLLFLIWISAEPNHLLLVISPLFHLTGFINMRIGQSFVLVVNLYLR